VKKEGPTLPVFYFLKQFFLSLPACLFIVESMANVYEALDGGPLSTMCHPGEKGIRCNTTMNAASLSKWQPSNKVHSNGVSSITTPCFSLLSVLRPQHRTNFIGEK
jgi:hypothetical protein